MYSYIHIHVLFSSLVFQFVERIFFAWLRLINIRHVYTWLQGKRVRFRFHSPIIFHHLIYFDQYFPQRLCSAWPQILNDHVEFCITHLILENSIPLVSSFKAIQIFTFSLLNDGFQLGATEYLARTMARKCNKNNAITLFYLMLILSAFLSSIWRYAAWNNFCLVYALRRFFPFPLFLFCFKGNFIHFSSSYLRYFLLFQYKLW